MNRKKTIFLEARLRAASWDSAFEARVDAALIVHIGKTRLGQIERGEVVPHRDEIRSMAHAYRCPQLLQWACEHCVIMRRAYERNRIEATDERLLAD